MTRYLFPAAIGLVILAALLAPQHGARADGPSSGAGLSATPFPGPALDDPLASQSRQESIVLAGGCFWGVQAVFERVKGVVSATSGYAGGSAKTASYHLVSTGATGHAESVRIVYDASHVSLGRLLQVFFAVAHDPTELNRQGPDFGPQYRSAVFYSNENQQRLAAAYVDQLDSAKALRLPIVTQVVPLEGFYPAEDYHQDYLEHHPNDPYILMNDLPKLARLQTAFPALYVDRK